MVSLKAFGKLSKLIEDVCLLLTIMYIVNIYFIFKTHCFVSIKHIKMEDKCLSSDLSPKTFIQHYLSFSESAFSLG